MLLEARIPFIDSVARSIPEGRFLAPQVNFFAIDRLASEGFRLFEGWRCSRRDVRGLESQRVLLPESGGRVAFRLVARKSALNLSPRRGQAGEWVCDGFARCLERIASLSLQ